MTNPVYKHILGKMRREWKANDDIRDKGFSIPESVETFDDISYGPHGKDNLLCIHRPKDHSREYPCIVIIHGGGFFYGDKNLYQFYSGDMAQRGFVTVVFNYRLCPENKFPAALEDINNVMKWIIANGKNYGINKDKIAFAGDSAGGNLSLAYAAILTNPEYASLFKFRIPENFKPAALLLNCSLNNLLHQNDKSSMELVHAYTGSRLRTKLNRERLDIQKYLTSALPPVYMLSAPNDFLLYQQQPQLEQFKSLGVEAVFKIYGEKDDESASHVFHLNQRLEIARTANDDEAAFLRKIMEA